MTNQFSIHCPKCGTHYNDLQEVCPYCGEPQPTHQPRLPVDIAIEPAFGLTQKPSPPTGSLNLDLQEYLLPEPLPRQSYPPPEAFIPNNNPFTLADATGQELEDHAAYPDGYDEDYYDDDALPSDQAEADYALATPYPLDPYNLTNGFEEEFLPEDDDDKALQPATHRFTWGRLTLGCFGILFCGALFYSSIGLVAIQQGLQERAVVAQSESQAHYQKGQTLLNQNSVELAIAEFERALNLNPNFPEARQALREAQKVMQAQPTPTSRTRSAAAVEIFKQAQAQFDQDNWADTIQTLSKVQDLDPNYQAQQVSDMLYTANVQLGLQLLSPDKIDQTLVAFDQALAQRPNDPEVVTEQAKALLYVEAITAQEHDLETAVELLEQLYQKDNSYLDVTQQLAQTYENFGDELVTRADGCLASRQYIEANTLQPTRTLENKITNSQAQCKNSNTTPPTQKATTLPLATKPAPSPTTTITPGQANTTTIATNEVKNQPVVPASGSGGSILYSAFNRIENRWEILAAPINGGSPKLVTLNATMPALSPNGQILLYHSESGDSEGLHALNLATGEDIRVTTVRDHLYPRWSNNLEFIFTSQEEATGRWQYFQAFADGKSDAIILGDGRTADWSRNGQTIAYQGTDPQGNQPGIYRLPFGGGQATRLTTHESDRSPAFSPDGSQIAYMSTQNGNWDIYTVPVSGGKPRQITTSPGNDGLPAWSPDGSQLAFVSDAGGSWAIYVADLNGSRLTRVTDWDGNRSDWLVSQIWWQP